MLTIKDIEKNYSIKKLKAVRIDPRTTETRTMLYLEDKNNKKKYYTFSKDSENFAPVQPIEK